MPRERTPPPPPTRGQILGRNWDKSLKSFPPCYSVTSANGFYSASPLRKSGLKLVYNLNMVYGNIKSENSQDNAQIPQRHFTYNVHEFNFRLG